MWAPVTTPVLPTTEAMAPPVLVSTAFRDTSRLMIAFELYLISMLVMSDVRRFDGTRILKPSEVNVNAELVRGLVVPVLLSTTALRRVTFVTPLALIS
jgi:hypothetical protein